MSLALIIFLSGLVSFAAGVIVIMNSWSARAIYVSFLTRLVGAAAMVIGLIVGLFT